MNSPSLSAAHVRANQDALRELIVQIAVIRETKGYTLDDIAAKMGVDKSAVSRLECGRTNPTLQTIGRYADAVGAIIVPVAVPAEDSASWAELGRVVSEGLDAAGTVEFAQAIELTQAVTPGTELTGKPGAGVSSKAHGIAATQA